MYNVLILRRKDVIDIKNTNKLRLFDSFAGVGALHSALTRLNVPLEVVGLSEIDPDAIINYCAIHIDTDLSPINGPSIDEKRQYLMDRNIGFSFEKNKSSIPRMRIDKLEKLYTASIKTKNFGDISKLNYKAMPDFDLFNFSFPCTDISNAGKQKGFTNEDGTSTRSGLVKYGIDLIRAKKPRYIMIENVKALIQKKFLGNFCSIIEELESIGYNCHYPTKQNSKKETVPSCLNAKDFGIPQSRQRIFVICILKEFDTGDFEFPKGFPLELRLSDILDVEVDEKYYLGESLQSLFKSKYNVKELEKECFKEVTDISVNRIGGCFDKAEKRHQSGSVYDSDGLCPTLTTCEGGYRQPIINELRMVGKIDKDGWYDIESRVYDFGGICPTMETRNRSKWLTKEGRLRKLTPSEAYKVMGFSDEEFEKAKSTGCSNSQLYKQAGNSIVVNILYYILKNLLGV